MQIRESPECTSHITLPDTASNIPERRAKMERQARQVLNYMFGWICDPLRLHSVPTPTADQFTLDQQQARLLSPGSADDPTSRTVVLWDAETQTSHTNGFDPLPITITDGTNFPLSRTTAWEVSGSEDGVKRQHGDQTVNANPHSAAVEYTDGESRIITVHDGAKDCITLVLNRYTAKHLQDLVRRRKDVRTMKKTYDIASRDADLGQSYLKYAPTMLEEATSEEEHDELVKQIEQRRSEVLKEIERKGIVEKELESKVKDLDCSRGSLENDLERMFDEAQLAEDCRQEFPTGMVERTSSTGVPENEEIQTQQAPIAEDEPKGLNLTEQVQVAQRELFEAQVNFDELRGLQEQQKSQYRQLRLEGHADFPEIELDFLQVQEGRRVTRALIEAEKAFEEARAAHAYGVLHGDISSETGLSEITGIGSGSGCDPARILANFDPSFAQAWAEDVSQSQDQETVNPELDDWDSRSVTPSDSQSAVAEGDYRILIGRWQYICETVRDKDWGGDLGDAGAMGRAIMTGKLQLIKN